MGRAKPPAARQTMTSIRGFRASGQPHFLFSEHPWKRSFHSERQFSYPLFPAADGQAMLRLHFVVGNSLFFVGCPEVVTFGASAGWRKARPVSGELRLRNGAAVKRINGGCKSLLTAQRSAVKQAGTRRSQAPRAAHSLLV